MIPLQVCFFWFWGPFNSISDCYLKAKQNQMITRKRPCSLSSGADSDIMLAITYETDKKETYDFCVKIKVEKHFVSECK